MESLPLLTIGAVFLFSSSCEAPMVNEPDLASRANRVAQLSLMTYDGVTESEINFGEVFATTSLSYILLNTGSVEVFDVFIVSNEFEIFPMEIGLIPAENNELIAYPIISVTLPHVIPPNGVGELLPMSLGEVTDTISLEYDWVAPFDSISGGVPVWSMGDTIHEQKKYPARGVKNGGIIEIYFSGARITVDSYPHNIGHAQIAESPESSVSLDFGPFSLVDIELIEIANTGNQTIELEVFTIQSNRWVPSPELLINPDTRNDVTSDVVLSPMYGYDFFMHFSSSVSIIDVAGRTFTEGHAYLHFFVNP